MSEETVVVRFLKKVVIPGGASYNVKERAALPKSVIEEFLEDGSVEVVKSVDAPPRNKMVSEPEANKESSGRVRRRVLV